MVVEQRIWSIGDKVASRQTNTKNLANKTQKTDINYYLGTADAMAKFCDSGHFCVHISWIDG